MASSDPQLATNIVQQPVKQGDKPSARRMNDFEDTTRSQLPLSRQRYRGGAPKPIHVRLTGGETIPANSPAEIVGRDSDGAFQVDRPTADSIAPGLILFTKDATIASGAEGFMYSAFDETLECQTAAAGVLGSTYGTQTDSFELLVDNTGFTCLGEGGAEAMMRPFRQVAVVYGYVFGGNNTSPATGEQYDVAGNSWSATANTPAPSNAREQGAAFNVGTVAFFAGGVAHDRCDEYNPTGDSWSTAPAAKNATGDGFGTAIGVLGYTIADGANACEKYDVSGNSWTTLADASASTPLGGCALGADIYAWTSDTDGSNPANDEYSVSGNSWSGVTAYTAGRRDTFAVELAGKGHAMGGQTFAIGPGLVYFDNNDQYDASGDSWTAKTVLDTATTGRAVFNVADKGYICGGNIIGTANIVTVEEYDAAGDSWAGVADMSIERTEGAGVAV